TDPTQSIHLLLMKAKCSFEKQLLIPKCINIQIRGIEPMTWSIHQDDRRSPKRRKYQYLIARKDRLIKLVPSQVTPSFYRVRTFYVLRCLATLDVRLINT
ncbi:hypothetical protein TNCT_30651, partial [Trichonephila clavata]